MSVPLLPSVSKFYMYLRTMQIMKCGHCCGIRWAVASYSGSSQGNVRRDLGTRLVAEGIYIHVLRVKPDYDSGFLLGL